MKPAPRARPTAHAGNGLPPSGRRQTPDDRLNQQMSRLMHEAADKREQGERARATEDERASRREAAALLELVRAHARPKVEAASPVQHRDAGLDRRELMP